MDAAITASYFMSMSAGAAIVDEGGWRDVLSRTTTRGSSSADKKKNN